MGSLIDSKMNIKKKLKEIKSKSLFRKFRTIEGACSSTVEFRNKEFIMLASNNYFGLNTHPRVIAAAKNALEKYGSGTCASRLVANLDLHNQLEEEIAEYKKCESALAYSSGYAANIGIISSIVGKGDVILSDELNHASIIDGCRLSRAEISVYGHCDVSDLESKLSRLNKKNALVVTDSIFSMGGDLAPLDEIIKLKKKHSFMLMVDDAHATGIIDTGIEGIDIHMGTLSKALASQGGFAAGSKELIDYLRNTSRSFMFSTGLSPPNAASALEALKIIKKSNNLRDKLLINAGYLRGGLAKLGFDVQGKFQIIPLFIGDNKKAVQFQKLLEKEGIFTAAIRPPTVPKAILRISVMATHTQEQMDKALKAFKMAGVKTGII